MPLCTGIIDPMSTTTNSPCLLLVPSFTELTFAEALRQFCERLPSIEGSPVGAPGGKARTRV
jgi:hypothetical protein